MATQIFDHAVGAALDYSFDWGTGSWLQDGETIITSVWDVPEGLTKSNEQILGGITSVFISGGSNGEVYKVINTVTTSNIPSRIDSRTLIISVHN